MKKRSRFYLYSTLVLVVAAVFSAYFYLPAILADTVYPLKYADLIRKYSEMHKVDPALMAGLIKQESNFNPTAKSYLGAVGLCQIMPTTGNSINKAFNIPGYSSEKLNDPEISIMFGSWYISTLIQRYNGNTSAALTAYNTGSGNVDRWFSPGIFFKGNSYAEKVLNYQSIYRQFYSKELYGVDFVAQVNIEKPKTSVVWKQMLTDLVGVFYGTSK